MSQPRVPLTETASQTAGPYLHIGLAQDYAGLAAPTRAFGQTLAGPDTGGERIRIEVRILDGLDTLVRDALVEIWQADHLGHYLRPGAEAPAFHGYGRACLDPDIGAHVFDTIRPGRVPAPDGRPMAPHVNLWIVARGINLGLHTRMYFGDEADANAADPVLSALEWDERRRTLIAPRTEVEGRAVFRFDIRLQGAAETVFFDV